MLKAKYIIDPFKGVTFLVVLAMMAVYDQWHNPTAWVYLALHGTYGILWVLKSRTFGDRQWEHTALKLRPGLITDGLWSRTRNPNYFGELLIYLGFGLLAMHWLPLLVPWLIAAAYWVPNMLKKDRSLSRYPEFAAYRERTKLFIPYLF